MALCNVWFQIFVVALAGIFVATAKVGNITTTSLDDDDNATTPEIFSSVSDLPFTNATNATNEIINLSQTVIFEVGVLEDDVYGKNETAVNSTINRLIGGSNHSKTAN